MGSGSQCFWKRLTQLPEARQRSYGLCRLVFDSQFSVLTLAQHYADSCGSESSKIRLLRMANSVAAARVETSILS